MKSLHIFGAYSLCGESLTFTFRKNDVRHSYMLTRNSTEWDQLAASDFIEFSANEYLTFRMDSVATITGFNRDWGAWNVLCFVR